MLYCMFYYAAYAMMRPQCVTIQMTTFEQYFHVVLIIMPHKVVLTFKSVDESSNEQY